MQMKTTKVQTLGVGACIIAPIYTHARALIDGLGSLLAVFAESLTELKALRDWIIALCCNLRLMVRKQAGCMVEVQVLRGLWRPGVPRDRYCVCTTETSMIVDSVAQHCPRSC